MLSNLRWCREEKLWSNGRDIVNCILRSCRERHLRLEPDQCLQVLDDGLACALETDPSDASHLAKTIVSLHNYSRVGRALMRGSLRRSLQENLRRLDLTLTMRPWSWEELAAHPNMSAWLSCF